MIKKIVAIGSLTIASIAFANNYTLPVPIGTIKGAEVTYNDSDTVTVKYGFGECSGFYWEIASPIDLDVTVPSSLDIVYIYIDHSECTYPSVVLTSSTTEPTYSTSKLGWYNGDDRCIGFALTTDGSTLLQFDTIGNIILYKHVGPYVAQNVDPNGWTSYPATGYTTDVDTVTPVFAFKVRIEIRNTDINDVVQVYARSVSTYDQIGNNSYYTAICDGWIITGTTDRSLDIYGHNDDDNALSMRIHGVEIER